MEAFVEAIRVDGSSDRFLIEGAEAIIGRSGTADISLPTESQLELEHMLIAPRGREGCWVSVSQSATNPTLLKGQPFRDGIVPWETEFSIGSLRLKLTTKRVVAKKESTSPILMVLLVLGIAWTGWTFWQEQESAIASSKGVEPPNLFADEVKCPANGDPSDIAAGAEEEGDSRGDRYVYEPQDGVKSVALYRLAESCY
ncbi:MAG: hypothetical protein R3A47_00090 [Polyangiales bacterium]